MVTKIDGQGVIFGKYKGEDISWLILSKSDGKMILISEYILDAKAYNKHDSALIPIGVELSWETCSLRNWLNNDFYNEAFNDEEKQKLIIDPKTNDIVTLLDYDTAVSHMGEWDLFEAMPTEYAKTTKLAINKQNGFSYYWWLKDPTKDKRNAISVLNGCVYSEGSDYYHADGGVRPVICVKN